MPNLFYYAVSCSMKPEFGFTCFLLIFSLSTASSAVVPYLRMRYIATRVALRLMPAMQ